MTSLETYLEGAELDSTTTENLIHAVNAFQNKEITLDEIVEEYGMWYKCVIQEYFMSKHSTAAVESALKFNQITVVEAIEMGISEEALQQIENDKVNAAYDRAVNDQVTIAINGAKIEQARQNRLSKLGLI